MKIDTAIQKAKKKLIAQAKRKGISENFGQSELLNIEKKFVHPADYSPETTQIRKKIEAFNFWIMDYELK